ncbi:MAG: cation-transporting P-type ATPase, partial [Verrucomicrobiota bacterium]
MNTQPNTPAPPPKRKPASGRVSAKLVEAGRMDAAGALRSLDSSLDGLKETVAEERFAQVGPNEVSTEKRHDWATR